MTRTDFDTLVQYSLEHAVATHRGSFGLMLQRFVMEDVSRSLGVLRVQQPLKLRETALGWTWEDKSVTLRVMFDGITHQFTEELYDQ